MLDNVAHDNRTIDRSTAGSFKRKSRTRDERFLEPASKTLKTKTLATKRLFNGDSEIRQKIHLDCLAAMNQDLNGN